MNNKNIYWEEAIKFKKDLIECIETILQVYGGEFLLQMEDFNLLTDSENSIESSTAIGYCLGEFIVSKLITFTKNNKENNGIKIQRNTTSTTYSSYDFF